MPESGPSHATQNQARITLGATPSKPDSSTPATSAISDAPVTSTTSATSGSSNASGTSESEPRPFKGKFRNDFYFTLTRKQHAVLAWAFTQALDHIADAKDRNENQEDITASEFFKNRYKKLIEQCVPEEDVVTKRKKELCSCLEAAFFAEMTVYFSQKKAGSTDLKNATIAGELGKCIKLSPQTLNSLAALTQTTPADNKKQLVQLLKTDGQIFLRYFRQFGKNASVEGCIEYYLKYKDIFELQAEAFIPCIKLFLKTLRNYFAHYVHSAKAVQSIWEDAVFKALIEHLPLMAQEQWLRHHEFWQLEGATEQAGQAKKTGRVGEYEAMEQFSVASFNANWEAKLPNVQFTTAANPVSFMELLLFLSMFSTKSTMGHLLGQFSGWKVGATAQNNPENAADTTKTKKTVTGIKQAQELVTTMCFKDSHDLQSDTNPEITVGLTILDHFAVRLGVRQSSTMQGSFTPVAAPTQKGERPEICQRMSHTFFVKMMVAFIEAKQLLPDIRFARAFEGRPDFSDATRQDARREIYMYDRSVAIEFKYQDTNYTAKLGSRALQFIALNWLQDVATKKAVNSATYSKVLIKYIADLYTDEQGKNVLLDVSTPSKFSSPKLDAVPKPLTDDTFAHALYARMQQVEQRFFTKRPAKTATLERHRKNRAILWWIQRVVPRHLYLGNDADTKERAKAFATDAGASTASAYGKEYGKYCAKAYQDANHVLNMDFSASSQFSQEFLACFSVAFRNAEEPEVTALRNLITKVDTPAQLYEAIEKLFVKEKNTSFPPENGEKNRGQNVSRETLEGFAKILNLTVFRKQNAAVELLKKGRADLADLVAQKLQADLNAQKRDWKNKYINPSAWALWQVMGTKTYTTWQDFRKEQAQKSADDPKKSKRAYTLKKKQKPTKTFPFGFLLHQLTQVAGLDTPTQATEPDGPMQVTGLDIGWYQCVVDGKLYFTQSARENYYRHQTLLLVAEALLTPFIQTEKGTKQGTNDTPYLTLENFTYTLSCPVTIDGKGYTVVIDSGQARRRYISLTQQRLKHVITNYWLPAESEGKTHIPFMREDDCNAEKHAVVSWYDAERAMERERFILIQAILQYEQDVEQELLKSNKAEVYKQHKKQETYISVDYFLKNDALIQNHTKNEHDLYINCRNQAFHRAAEKAPFSNAHGRFGIGYKAIEKEMEEKRNAKDKTAQKLYGKTGKRGKK